MSFYFILMLIHHSDYRVLKAKKEFKDLKDVLVHLAQLALQA